MKLIKAELNRKIWPWIMVSAGSILAAGGYVIFILPFDMIEGGVTGIGIILRHMTGKPIVGITSIIITSFVFIIAIKILGTGFGAKSIYATILMNILIDLFTIMEISIGLEKSDILLAAFYGGASVGIGLGMIYFSGASTGGSDAFAQILWRLKRVPIGRTLIIVDIFVLGIATIIFIPLKSIMYSMIFIYVEIKAIDMVLNGLNANQRIMIVTDVPETIKAQIFTSLRRGLTIFKAIGGYSGKERFMITSVLPKKSIPELRRIVAAVDPSAFVIIQDVNQVYGEGFEPLPKSIKKNKLFMYEDIKNVDFYNKLLKRDKPSFKKLYETFKIPLYRILFSIIKNDEKTADIIQDTFIKAIRKINQLNDINRIEYWLYRIAVNSALNVISKEKRLLYNGEMIGVISDKAIAENFIKVKNNKQDENYYLLLELIEELPAKYKIIVSLKYLDNLKETEISEILNIPVGTVKSRLSIARNKLRNMLSNRDI